MNKNKKTALFIGRFQPFHLGHFYVVKSFLEKYQKIIVAIGSPQEDYTLQNPLTEEERVKVIKDALTKNGVNKKRFKIVAIPDIPTNSLWPDYVRKKVGKFNEVITASPFTKLLFEDKGYRVVEHSLVKRKIFSGTEIRRRMLRGKRWDNLVLECTFVSLQKIGMAERLKEIAKSDNPYT